MTTIAVRLGQHPAQHLPQGGLHGHVERRHRLVEEQHPWVGGQRPGDGDPLGLAAGELRRAPPRQLADADLVEPALGVRARRPAGGTRAAWPEGDVLEGVEVREEQGVLAEQGRTPGVRRDHQARAARADVGEHLPVDGHPAGGGPDQAGQHPEERRLAGAVGAEQREGLTVGDLDGRLDVADGVGELDHDGHIELRPCRAKPMTTTATTSSTSARATAASGSVSRWR